MAARKPFLESLGVMLLALGVVGTVFGLIGQLVVSGGRQLPLRAEAGLVLAAGVALLVLGAGMRGFARARRRKGS